MYFRLITLVFFYCLPVVVSAQQRFHYPLTPIKPVAQTYFGRTITDNYSWLENTDDTAVQEWVQKQRSFTDSFLNTIPYYAKIEKNIQYKGRTSTYIPPSRRRYSFSLFGSEANDRQSVPILYYREKDDTQWLKLINPADYISKEGEHVVMTNYSLSDDDKYFAFSISRNGSDWNEIRILDMEKKRVLKDSLLWLKASFAIWYGDGFFYLRTVKPSDDSGQWALIENGEDLCYHRLNTPESDDIILPVQHCHKLEIVDSNLLIYTMSYKDGSGFYGIAALELNKANWSEQRPFTFMTYPAEIRYDVDVVMIRKDSAIVRNNLFAGNGMLASFNLKKLNSYKVLVPEFDEVMIKSFFKLKKLHCLYRSDSNYMMVKYGLDGKMEDVYHFAHYMSVNHFTSEDKATAFYRETSFDRPAIQYVFDFASYSSTPIGATYVPYDVNNYVYRQLRYRSSDSVEIPITLFYKKGLKINEQTPVLLTAYGGFGIIQDPQYSYRNILWAENGGICALASIRGGGEKGKSWHIAGSQQHKQQGIDDFIWAAKFLIENKYTSSAKLAITGASHGGLIVAAAVNQYPELFGAAIPVVGLFDILNYQNYTIGTRFSDEFGLSTDPFFFNLMHKYSPYHQIHGEKRYPAMLVMTGDHDDRVPPFNSYKYVAALQANAVSSNPVLLYVNNNAGHNGGITAEDELKEEAYFLTFLFHALDIKKPILMY